MELPSYEASVANGAGEFELRPLGGRVDLDIVYRKTKEYEDRDETTIMSHPLTNDTRTLQEYLKSQAESTPDPKLRIRGTHKGSYMADGFMQYNTQVDFELTISLQDQLAHRAQCNVVANSRKAYRGTRTKADALSSDADVPLRSLDDWCRDFCSYRKGPKSFTFACRIGALEKSIPIDGISKVLRDIKYRGKIEVTVEAKDRVTTLVSDHGMSRIRWSSFWWFLCLVSQLWIVFWFLNRRWEVLTIEWPTTFSKAPSHSREAQDINAAWLETWKIAVGRAASSKFRGNLSSPERDREGRAWKALGDFDEVKEWGTGDLHVRELRHNACPDGF